MNPGSFIEGNILFYLSGEIFFDLHVVAERHQQVLQVRSVDIRSDSIRKLSTFRTREIAIIYNERETTWLCETRISLRTEAIH